MNEMRNALQYYDGKEIIGRRRSFVLRAASPQRANLR